MAENTPSNNSNSKPTTNSIFDELTSKMGNNNPFSRNTNNSNNEIISLLQDINANIANLSQSELKSRVRGVDYQEERNKQSAKTKSKNKSFNDLLGDELKEAFGLDGFKKTVQKSIEDFAKGFGTDFEGLKQNAAKELAGSVKNSPIGKMFSSDRMAEKFDVNLKKYQQKNLAKTGTMAAKNSVQGLMQVGKAGLKAAGPQMALLAIVMDIAEVFMKFFGGLSKAANRDEESRKKKMEEGQKRLQADIESIVKQPFEILKEAAQAVYDVWDATLHNINQTQGYTKAELQSLYGTYAERLRTEGLSDAIAGSSVIENLNKTLESGLTGKAAEEFAYVATKLNAAIPNQDFFAYSDTYASYIANAIKNGMGDDAAIQYANKQLEEFASNVVYASRELSGGFSSGLKNSSELFAQANQIALAAKTNNASAIGGTLTSISAIVGAIAPDLTSGIVDAVYQAAVGGNSSQIVALRSLAGINASNTEFLRAFANNPQQIFSTLFNNLANMQNMSPNNYMEVAEGLADVFGLDKAAFQRVDFAYLADAVKGMQLNNKSLQENINLLASGETTLTKEQLKNRQINQYLVDEGLAYVLDNAVGRSIQEHMWQEQIALQLQEATYSVDLQGSALTFLSDLVGLVRTIGDFLNPFAWAQKIINLAQTADEASQNDSKIKEVLEAGKVGVGNQTYLKQLLTRANMIESGLGISWGYGVRSNGMLDLTKDYVDQLKESNQRARTASKYNFSQVSKSQAAALGTNASQVAYSGSLSSTSTANNVDIEKLKRLYTTITTGDNAMSMFFGSYQQNRMDQAIAAETEKLTRSFRATMASEYAVSKAAEALETKYNMGREQALARAKQQLLDEADAAARKQAESNIAKNKEEYASGYEAWYANASDVVGKQHEDIDKMLNELGIEQSDLKAYFGNADATASAASTFDRTKTEEEFWENSQKYLEDLNINIHDVLDESHLMGIVYPKIIEQFVLFRGEFKTFYDAWVEYYIKHTSYNEHLGVGLVAQWESVNRDANKAQADKLNTLTELLTSNSIADLMDPTVQQNVLLAQILSVLQGIFQQNNTQGKLKLPDALSALATGMLPQD